MFISPRKCEGFSLLCFLAKPEFFLWVFRSLVCDLLTSPPVASSALGYRLRLCHAAVLSSCLRWFPASAILLVVISLLSVSPTPLVDPVFYLLFGGLPWPLWPTFLPIAFMIYLSCSVLALGYVQSLWVLTAKIHFKFFKDYNPTITLVYPLQQLLQSWLQHSRVVMADKAQEWGPLKAKCSQ